MGLTDDSIVTAMLLGLLGLVCFQLGYRSWQRPRSRQRAQRTWLELQPSQRRARHRHCARLLQSHGGGAGHWQPHGRPAESGAAAHQPHRLRLPRARHGLAPDIVLIAWADHLQTRKRWLFLPLILTSNMYISPSVRLGILNLWLSMLVIYAYHRRGGLGLRGWLTAISVGCFALGLSLLLMEVRNTDITIAGDLGDVGTSLTFEDKVGETSPRRCWNLIRSTSSHFWSRRWHDLPRLWGESYLGLFIQLVPRWLVGGQAVALRCGYWLGAPGVRTAIPPSMVGELHVNFDIPGIASACF